MSLVTSNVRSVILPPYFLANSAKPSDFSGLRAEAITSQPSDAYCRANSNPIPRLAPVINTVAISAPIKPIYISYRSLRFLLSVRCLLQLVWCELRTTVCILFHRGENAHKLRISCLSLCAKMSPDIERQLLHRVFRNTHNPPLVTTAVTTQLPLHLRSFPQVHNYHHNNNSLYFSSLIKIKNSH